MRKYILLAFLGITNISIIAQTPEAIKYQAVIRNAEGNILPDTQVELQAGILEGDVSASPVYLETFSVKTNKQGLISINIGKGKVISGTFAAINWETGEFFIKIWVNGRETGTSQLLSVPYALHAKTAENIFSGRYDDLSQKPDFTGWDTNSSDDFDGNYLNLAGAPTKLSDFTNDESFVKPSDLEGYDNNVSDDFSGDFKDLKNVPADLLDGDDNTHLSEETVDEYVSNNGYLISEKDSSVENELQTLSKVLDKASDAGGKQITNLAGPINSRDAVNKEYVDQLLQRIETLERQNENSYSADSGTFIDYRDGNEYKWVRIGDQIWMAENLKYFPDLTNKYNGETYKVYGYTGTDSAEAKATENYKTFGVLYSYTAAIKSCPAG